MFKDPKLIASTTGSCSRICAACGLAASAAGLCAGISVGGSRASGGGAGGVSADSASCLWQALLAQLLQGTYHLLHVHGMGAFH